MSDSASNVRRLATSKRLINVLSVVASKRHPITTNEVLAVLKYVHGDEACHRTVYRALLGWEECGFIRRIETPHFQPLKWKALSRIVRVDNE